MLQIFRRARQKLVEQGNFQKYGLYAIGEITLVMIGILLALQVNTWNDQRKGDIEKNKIYQALEQEFLTAQETHTNNEYLSRVTQKAMVTILKNTGKSTEAFESQEFDSLLNISMNQLTFNPSFIVYEEIIGSDKIELIDNPRIKALLYRYKTTSNGYFKLETAILDMFTQEFVPYLNRHIAFKNLDQFNQAPFPSSTLLEDNRQVLMDLEFENLLDNHRYLYLQLVGGFDQLGEIIDALVVELQKVNEQA